MTHPNAPDAPKPPPPGEESPTKALALAESPSPLAQPAVATGGALAMAQRAEAEIKARTFVALNNPRSFQKARLKLLEACQRPRFADSAIYAVPRGKKDVEGLSIRFAEECARHWGNLDIGSVIIADTPERRDIECYAVDLETNVPWRRQISIEKTVERRSVDRGETVLGQRKNTRGDVVYLIAANDEQLVAKQNAMISKTLRVLILNHIPSDLKEEALELMEAVLLGQITDNPIEFRKRLVDSFRKISITVADLEELLGKPLDDATKEELKRLNRIGKAIAEGETTWREVQRDQREQRATDKARDAADAEAEKQESTTATGKTGATNSLREKLGKKPENDQ